MKTPNTTTSTAEIMVQHGYTRYKNTVVTIHYTEVKSSTEMLSSDGAMKSGHDSRRMGLGQIDGRKTSYNTLIHCGVRTYLSYVGSSTSHLWLPRSWRVNYNLSRNMPSIKLLRPSW